jgi:rubrerythrin
VAILVRQVGALKNVYEIVFDIAKKANLPTEVAKLRGKLEQPEEEHARQVQQLKQKIKGLEAIVKQSSPPRSSKKTRPVAANERIDKDDLPLDSQGW